MFGFGVFCFSSTPTACAGELKKIVDVKAGKPALDLIFPHAKCTRQGQDEVGFVDALPNTYVYVYIESIPPTHTLLHTLTKSVKTATEQQH